MPNYLRQIHVINITFFNMCMFILQMAVQVCGHGPLIFEVQTGLNHSGRENPYNYYTVNW